MHSRRQIFVKSPYGEQAVAMQLDPAQSVLTLSGVASLLESSQRNSLSDFCVALDGKPLNGSTRIQVSKLPSVSMLTLYPRLRGGGGDGGATEAESRDCYLKMYAEKKPDKVDPNEQRLSKWLNCALSNEPLAEPCVIDLLGNWLNKEALVNALLTKRLPKQFSYIKGLKDMVNIKLMPVAGSDGSSQDTTSAQFQYPVSGLEFNGKYKFFALRGCGHVMSSKALKEVKSSSCLVCHADVKDSDKIVINGTEEEVSLLREKMEEEKAKLREKKGASKKSKNDVAVVARVSELSTANRQAISDGGGGGCGDDKDMMSFDIEEHDGAIPGLFVSASEGGGADRGVTQGTTVIEQVGDGGYGGQGEGDDWDSDSEDDLQILLNDSSRNVTIGARMGDNEDDDDDDDEEPLVKVADTYPNQPIGPALGRRWSSRGRR